MGKLKTDFVLNLNLIQTFISETDLVQILDD